MSLDVNRMIGFESIAEGEGWRVVALVRLPGTDAPGRFESFAADEVTAMTNVAEELRVAYEHRTGTSVADVPKVDPARAGKAAVLAGLVDVDDVIEAAAEPAADGVPIELVVADPLDPFAEDLT